MVTCLEGYSKTQEDSEETAGSGAHVPVSRNKPVDGTHMEPSPRMFTIKEQYTFPPLKTKTRSGILDTYEEDCFLKSRVGVGKPTNTKTIP